MKSIAMQSLEEFTGGLPVIDDVPDGLMQLVTDGLQDLQRTWAILSPDDMEQIGTSGPYSIFAAQTVGGSHHLYVIEPEFGGCVGGVHQGTSCLHEAHQGQGIGTDMTYAALAREDLNIFGPIAYSRAGYKTRCQVHRRFVLEALREKAPVSELNLKAYADDIERAGIDPTPSRAAFLNAYPWRRQPDGITCGPSAIGAALDYIWDRGPDTLEIARLCGTNSRTGTTDVAMKQGMDALGVSYVHPTREDRSSLDFLDQMLEEGNIVLLRTMIHSMKHWVSAVNKSPIGYGIACSCAGTQAWTAAEVEKVWAARDYDCMVIPSGPNDHPKYIYGKSYEYGFDDFLLEDFPPEALIDLGELSASADDEFHLDDF